MLNGDAHHSLSEADGELRIRPLPYFQRHERAEYITGGRLWGFWLLVNAGTPCKGGCAATVASPWRVGGRRKGTAAPFFMRGRCAAAVRRMLPAG